jgi:hypothetical protein
MVNARIPATYDAGAVAMEMAVLRAQARSELRNIPRDSGCDLHTSTSSVCWKPRGCSWLLNTGTLHIHNTQQPLNSRLSVLSGFGTTLRFHR